LPETENAKEVYILEMGISVEAPGDQAAAKESYGAAGIGSYAADAVWEPGEATNGDILCMEKHFTTSDGTRIICQKRENTLAVYRGKARVFPNQKNGKYYITIGAYSNSAAVKHTWCRATYLVVR
jgi:hydrogenase maturation factor